jgi:hypothetical protein
MQARKEFMDVAKKLHDVNAFVSFASLLQVRQHTMPFLPQHHVYAEL